MFQNQTNDQVHLTQHVNDVAYINIINNLDIHFNIISKQSDFDVVLFKKN